MRLSELSERSGVSVHSIKFYLREGLLPPGERKSARLSEYDEQHLRRLRLIRAMLTVGGLSLTQARDVLAVAEDPAFGRTERIGAAQYLLPPHIQPPEDEVARREWDQTRAQLAEMLHGLTWRFDDSSPSLDSLTKAVLALRSLGYGDADLLRQYAELVRQLAAAEYGGAIHPLTDLDKAMEGVIVYTLLAEPVLLALRRLAHEDTARRLHDGE
ncbi:MerR family transcriptional regulator [Actinomadura barringtoniae]|uniref:MerR family transcriptional regulator n=1 Tax=Actinomadura barringtoniae TaxID=1427535 RepID=A0A939P760_9ACTN|nr:MerR family transcriptional regulator [Actinomadura barringtoniae]MBO2446780.1 MerR family transcriptional regulator [Actinomadura barringtoniae]